MGHTIVVVSTKAQGSNAKPTNWFRAVQNNQNEGRSDTKGGQQLVHSEPHRGDLTSSNFVSEPRPGGFLHAPRCGLAPSHSSFSTRDYVGKTLETTWFVLGLGGISPCLVQWGGTFLGWLSPANGDPGNTQILTRHCSAHTQTVSQLESSGTTPTSKSL
jgi:hypothetical protein